MLVLVLILVLIHVLVITGEPSNRTYGGHKNLYIHLFFTNNIWSYLLSSFVIVFLVGVFCC